ncbi:MAG: hypothetical protein EOO80_01570 [Oxalobacteraceae bacterium]|nr:MAG: hypothetical protein EOO80_01570 [Oxalobacteraceae bacterium]
MVLTNLKTFPERKDVLVKEYCDYENFFPLITLNLSEDGISDPVQVMYVSFNYDAGPEHDINFPTGEDMDHFTFQIQKNGRYKPTFSKSALIVDKAYKPYFEISKGKIFWAKRNRFDVV